MTNDNSAPRNLTINFDRIRVGGKKLEDPAIILDAFSGVQGKYVRKHEILRAIDRYDLKLMREASRFFYRSSGIYSRIIRYMAFFYKYDWCLTPIMPEPSKVNKTKLMKNFYDGLAILDNFGVKKFLGETAVKVLRDGVYYGYRTKKDNKWTIQELPIEYCRTRFTKNGKPVVEFNMAYFDTQFRNSTNKDRILDIFPPEFKKGYRLYKRGKLQAVDISDGNGWYLLDPEYTIRFTCNGEEYPAFISVIPLIIDLANAQELDRQKAAQELIKMVIQHIPHDNDGNLMFEPDEAQQLHNNAVNMLSRTIGIEVLTTYADVEIEDLMNSNAATSRSDDLQRVERSLYNEAGVSQKQFNTDGNLALEKSILNDAATMSNLILQFEQFLNELVSDLNRKGGRQYTFNVQLLTTTIYNYQDMAKLFKEQTQLGYSKMLPQIALGQSQSSILSTAYFENDFLDLVNLFIPPMSSNVMNADVLANRGKEQTDEKQAKAIKNAADDNQGGRPEKDNDEKAEKTILNKESMN